MESNGAVATQCGVEEGTPPEMLPASVDERDGAAPTGDGAKEDPQKLDKELSVGDECSGKVGAVAGDGLTNIATPENGTTDAEKEVASPMATLKFAYLSLFIDIIGLAFAIPVIPFFQRELGISDTASGLLFSIYAFASACSQAVTGFLSDRYGRRPILLLSMFGSAVGFVLTGLTKPVADALGVDPVLILFVMRFIAGASGNSRPVVAAMIGDCTTTLEERTKYYGLVGACTGVGFTLGPGLGAAALVIAKLLADDILTAFAGIFFASGFICFLGFLFAARKLKETMRARETTEANASSKPTQSLRQSAVMPLLAVPFFQNYAFTTMQSTIGFLLQDVYFNKSEDASSAVGLVLFMSGWVLAGVQGGVFKKIAPKLGLVPTCLLGSMLLAVGTTLVGVSAHFAWHIVLTLAFFFFLFIVGIALMMPSVASLTSSYAPPGKLGAAQGIMGSAQMMANVIGPVCACALYERGLIYAWLAAGCVAFLVFVPLLITARVHAACSRLDDDTKPTMSFEEP